VWKSRGLCICWPPRPCVRTVLTYRLWVSDMSGCSLTQWTISASSCTPSSLSCHRIDPVWPPIHSGSHRVLLPVPAVLRGSSAVSRGVHSMCCGFIPVFLENLVVIVMWNVHLHAKNFLRYFLVRSIYQWNINYIRVVLSVWLFMFQRKAAIKDYFESSEDFPAKILGIQRQGWHAST
jgi:hypothetical protein